MSSTTDSRALAFSTKGGRSYTGSLAIVDEADFIPDLGQFLNAVKPTVDGGGQLFLISTSDKRRPVSPFKNLFRAATGCAPAVGGAGAYEAIFLPWQARPDRDAAWYARTKAEMFAQRGTDDDFYAEYPATPEEALAPLQFDRRIPYMWIEPVFVPRASAPQAAAARAAIGRHPSHGKAPSLPGLAVYVTPQPDRAYVIGADPAEGNPNSDESAATALDSSTGEEVAAGRADRADGFRRLSGATGAGITMPLSCPSATTTAIRYWQRWRDRRVRVLCGHDGKPGWLSNAKGKTLLYNALADAIRDGACIIHTAETAGQIASIEASTLRAPQGLHDDRADSFALAIVAANRDNRVTPAHMCRSRSACRDRFGLFLI